MKKNRGACALPAGAAVACLVFFAPCRAQTCEPSLTGTEGNLEPNAQIFALCLYDPDGAGPKPPVVIAGGEFDEAGGIAATGIASWDGRSWSPLGAGIDQYGHVHAVVSFDDGTGPALYVGGHFDAAGGVSGTLGIARWDGASWTSVGGGLTSRGIDALAVYNDGRGPALYAAGGFTSIGGVAANSIARWDGHAWSPLAAGFEDTVYALVTYDDGRGPALYAGGHFLKSGGVQLNGIGRWDGHEWSPLKVGIGGEVRCLLPAREAGRDVLYVGGYLGMAGSVPLGLVGRWDGKDWSSVGIPGGSRGGVYSLATSSVEGKEMLYAGGPFTVADDQFVDHVARWDGVEWTEVGGGVSHPILTYVNSLLRVGEGAAERFIVAGEFTVAGGKEISNIVDWDGVSFGRLGECGEGFAGLTGRVLAIEPAIVGGRPLLFVGGDFIFVGSCEWKHLAAWTGRRWETVGGGPDGPVGALEWTDIGGEPRLIVGGEFTGAGGVSVRNLAAWDGAAWWDVGGGVAGPVRALETWSSPSGRVLVVGGSFLQAGAVSARHIATWDGAAWSALDEGVSSDGMEGEGVYSLGVFDEGGGPDLYAGGRFTRAGSRAASLIARWDGNEWTPVGGGLRGLFSGVPTAVNAIRGWDDGAGPALYAAGAFYSAGGKVSPNAARWKGGAWSPVGSGLSGRALGLLEQKKDGGSVLLAAGGFKVGGIQGLALFDGNEWSGIGAGVGGSGTVEAGAIGIFDDGAGEAAYFGGSFTRTGTSPAGSIVRWGCSAPECHPDCNKDGKLNINDFICMQAKWRARDPYGDYDGSGTYTVNDFIRFQGDFVKGCE